MLTGKGGAKGAREGEGGRATACASTVSCALQVKPQYQAGDELNLTLHAAK